MKRCIVASLAALLMAGGLVDTAPPASAGCIYGGPVLSKCDGPIQPDGTWQRCITSTHLSYQGASSFLIPEKSCDVMAPGGPGDPPTHID
jgi:hypothetical protein